ncbi:GPI ethanolamine phosphate transferase 3 [Golovinomyces cichoracearum]|uniref:GPI ethanolamine phosphate transferase 3 n=1 Tax=Golovinomyces cichoracearum TaxID=62708 RepID=A0A420JAG7_9PEZI|nr:GPI ethanolamine phosphate transferase 3 [Golovinomyces cichoracearum]
MAKNELTPTVSDVNQFRVPKAVDKKMSSVATQYAQAKPKVKRHGVKENELCKNDTATIDEKSKRAAKRLSDRKKSRFLIEWVWAVGFFIWLLFAHATGIYFFSKGFLLTRLVLQEKSSCEAQITTFNQPFKGISTYNAGCWHPKSFDKAVIIIIDALRYDFTIPHIEKNKAFQNSLPFLYDTAIKEPQSAFLLPFIADPPTTTLQRLKGLTTGTLPTLVDLGSSFAGTAVEEDNLLIQLKNAGKKIVHLGDDTWTALFPGYFEEDISRAYDSFNVWDLHTVDDGVTEHIMPLLKGDKNGTWDVIIAHYLGVDHAGHRYGPDHPAMATKLQQMDGILREIVNSLDEKTLLVVMGDHGMDKKGDHGGESDDEVQAALWMYSKKRIFGRTDSKHILPPKSAKERFVNQIDFVPTLSLLLGIPIPFNNLGKPIEEAFVGKKGNAWNNLASVARITATGIKRYQAAYYAARGIFETSDNESTKFLWESGEKLFFNGGKKEAKDIYIAYTAFSQMTLKFCRNLWARFNLLSMAFGIGILLMSVVILISYVSQNIQEEPPIDENPETYRAELKLEMENFSKGIITMNDHDNSSKTILRGVLISSLFGILLSPALWILNRDYSIIEFLLGTVAVSGLLGGLFYQDIRQVLTLSKFLPKTFWSWLALIFTASQALGFASNSYTIWEDSILLFFISTFGISALLSSSRLSNNSDRVLGMYHSLVFTFLGWAASFSKLCREEQIPYCRSTYYVSDASSTSAHWQLLIPFAVALILPSVIKSFYTGSRSYEGFAPIWISWVFRIGLFLNAIFWVLNSADDGEWFHKLGPVFLKQIRVVIAQTIFSTAIIAGSIAFIYAPPCVSINTTKVSDSKTQKSNGSVATVTILGFANVHGTRYFFLLLNVLLCLLLLQKPMGAGALSLMAWQILALAEILDLNSLTSSPVGPVMLAILGSFYFFKTGHQTTLSSIQWETAFIPFYTIRYPYSPILVALNTFGSQVLAVAAIPLIVIWKQKPRKKHILRSLVCALAWHLSYYVIITASTSVWAAWLRRHLMLYRIFSPKFMTAAFVLLIIDTFGILLALAGFCLNTLSVAETFGWV